MKKIIAIAIAIAVVALALSGCSGGMSNGEKFDSCQAAVDATLTETALKKVLSTQPQCVEIEGRIGMYRFAGEDHDMVVLESTEAGGFDLVAPKWLDDLYEERYLAQRKKEDAEFEKEWQEELDARDDALPDTYEDWGSGGGGGGGGGQCVWSPTMNYDWHDDYVCGGVRQYFLPNDDYIEQWEIDAAAREWEESH